MQKLEIKENLNIKSFLNIAKYQQLITKRSISWRLEHALSILNKKRQVSQQNICIFLVFSLCFFFKNGISTPIKQEKNNIFDVRSKKNI